MNKQISYSKRVADIEDTITFKRCVDVINYYLGKNYAGWQRGTYPISDDKKISFWFPKMAYMKNGCWVSQSMTKDWVNLISSDGKSIEMRGDMSKHNIFPDNVNVVFGKDYGGDYRFLGVFADFKISSRCKVFRRIGTVFDFDRQEILGKEDALSDQVDKKKLIEQMAERLNLIYRLLPYENQITLKNNKNRIVCMIRPSKKFYQLMSNKEFPNSEYHSGWRVKYAVRLSTIEEVENVIVNELIPRFANTISISDRPDFDPAEPDYVLEADLIDKEIDNLQIEGGFREAVVKQRVNQSVFRDRLLKRFKHCCLCDVSNTDLLRASHIKPWSVSSSKEKVDVNNGLLLCPNHDQLFDQGYISFDDDGKIIVSNKLSSEDAELMNIRKDMCIDVGIQCRQYLEYHRKRRLKM